MPSSQNPQSVRTIYLFLAIIMIEPSTSFSQSHPFNGPDQFIFPIKEATVDELQAAFELNKLTSRELVEFYINQIKNLNPTLRAIIEVSPDALEQAQRTDEQRRARGTPTAVVISFLCYTGIPILLKDNIATKDKMNTTAGSYALLRSSAVAKDAGVVKRLWQAGAIILGEASLSEWANFRSFIAPSDW